MPGGWQSMRRCRMALLAGSAAQRPDRDRLAALAGMLCMAVFVVGQYVAPELVWPEESVRGVVASFHVSFEGRLLAQAVLSAVASGLFLVVLGWLRAFLTRAEGQEPRLAPVVVAAGSVATVLVLLQASAALPGGGAAANWGVAALLAWVGAAFGLLAGVLAVAAIAGLDIGAAGQAIFLIVAAWLVVLAFGGGWPLPGKGGLGLNGGSRPGRAARWRASGAQDPGVRRPAWPAAW